jgi:hypothetical protein
MSKPMGYDKKSEDMWTAAKRQTWEKLRTLREVIAESAAKSKKEEAKKMSHHDKKKPENNKPNPKPKSKRYKPRWHRPNKPKGDG